MTQLANNLIELALKDSAGWKEAKQQHEAMQMGEGSTEYNTK